MPKDVIVFPFVCFFFLARLIYLLGAQLQVKKTKQLVNISQSLDHFGKVTRHQKRWLREKIRLFFFPCFPFNVHPWLHAFIVYFGNAKIFRLSSDFSVKFVLVFLSSRRWIFFLFIDAVWLEIQWRCLQKCIKPAESTPTSYNLLVWDWSRWNSVTKHRGIPGRSQAISQPHMQAPPGLSIPFLFPDS